MDKRIEIEKIKIENDINIDDRTTIKERQQIMAMQKESKLLFMAKIFIYMYGFFLFHMYSLFGYDKIKKCEKCKNYFYKKLISRYHDYDLCDKCISICCRNINLIQYDEDEKKKIDNIVNK